MTGETTPISKVDELRISISRRRLMGMGAAAGVVAAGLQVPSIVRAAQDGGEITVYSGRSENLIGPALDAFSEASGVTINARYGSTSEMAATILEEGDNSPADVYIAQDAGALGAVQQEGLFADISSELLERVAEQYRSAENQWVGLTGRARVAVYNTDLLAEGDLPGMVEELVDSAWDGNIAWAPPNGSFQSFVTAFRVVNGEDVARTWLEDMQVNGAVSFDGNGPIVRAVGAGEIPAGLVNHYYLYEIQAEEGELPIANHFFAPGNVGTLVNVSGAGILASAANADNAALLLDYLLSEDAQSYFATTTFEYPLIEGVSAVEELTPLDELESPAVDLSDLSDLEGTLNLLTETGLL